LVVDPNRSPQRKRNGRTAKILLRESEDSKNAALARPAPLARAEATAHGANHSAIFFTKYLPCDSRAPRAHESSGTCGAVANDTSA
jgi:hypothetical protein